MKTYLFFAYNSYEQIGGMYDCVESGMFDSDTEAKTWANAILNRKDSMERVWKFDYYDLVWVDQGTWEFLDYKPIFEPSTQDEELKTMLGEYYLK